MTQEQIIKNYESAKAEYAAWGVDTDRVLEQFSHIAMGVHCWQGDDIKGFENLGPVESQNLVTGSYPGAARNAAELRRDIEKALSLSPLAPRVALQSVYAEKQNPRNDLHLEDFEGWIEWAKKLHCGLDYNTSYFAHPRMNKGMSLACLDKDTRDWWIEAGIDAREISVGIGRALGDRCINNLWIPDGMKDTPANRFRFRQLLTDSLDKIFAKKYTPEEEQFAGDVMEGKLFGIGVESFTVGSHDFYLGYAASHGVGVCLDTGHFHPTESVADKLSSYTLFVRDVLLHVSRGIRWDSDHVVVQNDEIMGIMQEMRRGNLYGRVGMGLDFFDASINRVAAWTVGLRASAKCILASLLEPFALLDAAELEGDFTRRLMLSDEFKNLPVNAVWDYVLMSRNIPDGRGVIDEIKRYESTELARRC